MAAQGALIKTAWPHRNDRSSTRLLYRSTDNDGSAEEVTLWNAWLLGSRADASPTLGALTSSAAGVVALDGKTIYTLGALISTAAGAVALVGASSTTLGAATSSAAGVVAVSGAAAVSLGAATPSASGTVAVSGASSVSLSAATSSAAGAVAVAGSSSPSLGAATSAGSGVVAVVGASSVALGAVASSSAGAVPVIGAASQGLGVLVLTAAGTAGQAAITGAASITLGALYTVGARQITAPAVARRIVIIRNGQRFLGASPIDRVIRAASANRTIRATGSITMREFNQAPSTIIDYQIDWTARVPAGQSISSATWSSDNTAAATVAERATSSPTATGRVTAVGTGLRAVITCQVTFSDSSVDSQSFSLTIRPSI